MEKQLEEIREQQKASWDEFSSLEKMGQTKMEFLKSMDDKLLGK